MMALHTPSKSPSRRIQCKYTPQEKEHLLRNLDTEVEHRTRQFERSLADTLQNFRIRHEGHILRVPRLVRSVTMAEFSDKYHGNVEACLRGLQFKQLGRELVVTDTSTRKRKWQESRDVVLNESEVSRAVKNVRTKSPEKNLRPTATRTLLQMQVTKSNCTPNLSPQRIISVRTNSPSKMQQPKFTPTSTIPPSSSTFNPILPKTSAYPRPPRKYESLLSINGSPLALPPSSFYADSTDNSQDNSADLPSNNKTLTFSSNIIVRRDPSFMSTSSREDLRYPDSQSSFKLYKSSQITSLDLQTSNKGQPFPNKDIQWSPQLRPSASAIVRVPTKDGHVLEFDPLLTSPKELDIVQGITDSAKKQAKEDMVRLVHSALTKWKIL